MASQHSLIRSPEAIRDELKAKLDGLVEASVDELHDFAGQGKQGAASATLGRSDRLSPEARDVDWANEATALGSRRPDDESLKLGLSPLEPDDDDDDGALSRYHSVEEPQMDDGDDLDDDTYEGVKTAIERSSQQSSPISPASASHMSGTSSYEPQASTAQPYNRQAACSMPQAAGCRPSARPGRQQPVVSKLKYMTCSRDTPAPTNKHAVKSNF